MRHRVAVRLTVSYAIIILLLFDQFRQASDRLLRCLWQERQGELADSGNVFTRANSILGRVRSV
jgi:hypothetical protein